MRPEQDTTKAGSHEGRVSRCSVCARRRPDVKIAGFGPGPASGELNNDYTLQGAAEVTNWG